MKRVIRLTESDLVRIVKRVINEQPTDMASIDPVEKIIDSHEVSIKVFRLNPNSPANPDKISAVKYDSETGDVMDATDGNKVIAKAQTKLTDKQFVDWLKRNKLRKKRQ